MTGSSEARFTRDHEWARWDNGRVRVGISDFAQDQVGDVVFIDLPAVGRQVTAGEGVAEVESTKTVSSILAPVCGAVVAVHEALGANPDLINSDPYGEGWMFEIEPGDPGELDALMDEAAYLRYVKEAAH